MSSKEKDIGIKDTGMKEVVKPALVPKRRFPEFQNVGGWEEKFIGSYLQDCSGRVPPDTELPVYSSTREGLKRQDAYFDGRVLQNKNDYGVVPTGCLVYRHMSDDGLFKFNINNTRSEIAVSKEYPVFSTKDLNAVFLLAKLNDGLDFKQFALSQKAGGTRTRLYFSRLCEWRTTLPTYAEQQKIAECLTSLDEAITAQAHKVDALKQHKKGLMQELFPREGESQPRLRFSEFRGAGKWTAKPLKAAAQVNPFNKGLPESFTYIDLESVNAGELKAKSRISRSGAPSRAQRLLEHGDIIYQIVRPYQRNNLLCEFDDDDDYVASTGYAQLRAMGSNRFLYQSIHTDSFVNMVITKCTGSSYPAINSSDLAEIEIPFPPTLDEQQKIAECLSSLDEAIAAQTHKVETLRAHKKGLMQELFPSIEEAEA